MAKNGLAWSRLGLRVGKRVGNAVRRNYVRRRIREAFRTAKDDIPGGFDIICVARAGVGHRFETAATCDLAGSLRTLVVAVTAADEEGSKRRPGTDPGSDGGTDGGRR